MPISSTVLDGCTSREAADGLIMSWDGEGDNDSDAITVVYGDPSLRMNTEASISTCDAESLSFDLTVRDHDTKISEYEAGELIMCSDYANLTGIESYMWVISSVSSSSGVISIEDASGYTDYANVCGTSENLSPSMLCSKAHVLTFYIDANASDGVGPGSEDNPVLMMDLNLDWPSDDDVPLVDNIEDLQFEYCVDDGSTKPDCTAELAWVDEVAAGSESDIWMTRISLVGRSSRKDPQRLRTSTRPELANHSAGSSLRMRARLRLPGVGLRGLGGPSSFSAPSFAAAAAVAAAEGFVPRAGLRTGLIEAR